MEADFQAMYPIKPPKITFIMKIYHLYVDDKGKASLLVISTGSQKPSIVELAQPEYLFQTNLAE